MSKEAIQKGIDALRGVITWDIMRNHLVPYRVRDPIHEAIEALAALAEQPAQRTWVSLTDAERYALADDVAQRGVPVFEAICEAEAKLKDRNQ